MECMLMYPQLLENPFKVSIETLSDGELEIPHSVVLLMFRLRCVVVVPYRIISATPP